jgi:hypothetical protein
VEDKPLEMCMDVFLDLGCPKSIVPPRGLNEEEITINMTSSFDKG